MKNFKRIISVFSIVTLVAMTSSVQAQWSMNPFDQKMFIENKGQFDVKTNAADPIIFGASNMGYQLYFTRKGFEIRFDINESKKNRHREGEEEEEEEREEVEMKTTIIKYEWQHVSEKMEVIPEKKVSAFFNYPNNQDHSKSIYNCNAYEKIVYQNIYDGIDLEFIFHPQQGIKYSYLVHPGGDPSKIQINYHARSNPKLIDGRIVFSTKEGKIIENAPVAFYKDNNVNIPCSFKLNGDRSSFAIDAYDQTKEMVIDPWVIVPTIPTNNKAFEVQKDAAGNVYVYGGTTPFVLNKYTSLGALVWSTALSLSSPTWTGDLLVDASGFCYVTDASVGPGNNIQKIDNVTGASVWSVYTAGGEFFRLTHNCDKSKVYTAGGPALAYMKEINPATGAATTSLFMAGNAEIKSISRSPNGNYYFLTNSNNRLYAASGAFTVLWSIPNTHNYTYYTPAYLNQNGGSNYIATNGKFIYTYDGTLLLKRDICNGNLLASTNVPGGIFEMNGGLMLDSCGDLYAGSQAAIYKYDPNLNIITSVATAGAIYDISLGINAGEVLACGNAIVASINISVCHPIPFASTCPPILTASITTTIPTCGSSCTGTATVTPTGTGPYTYSWLPGSLTTQTITGLCAGTYSVYVTDRYTKLCTPVTTIITMNPVPTVSISSQTNVLCNGATTGSATSTGSGGTSPYTYLWSNTQTNSVATGLGAGTYTVTITDANGCTNTQTVTITQPTAITSSVVSQTNVLCFSQCTGSATISAGGGTPGYTYNWTPSGGTTVTATGRCAGNYTCTITDANGCTRTQAVVITQPASAISASASSTNTGCTSSTGTATVSASGGTGGLTYSWAPSAQTGTTATGLGVGTYTVYITDANGCTQTATTTVNGAGGPTASISSSTNILCNGGNNGSATASATGGTSPYTYLWSNSQTNANATGLIAGTYTITVTDANGCTSQQTITITQPTPIVASATFTNTSCGNSTGTATASASGGTGPYTYSWNNSQTTITATGLGAATYTIYVTDANGCTQTTTVTVGNSSGPTASTNVNSNVLCNAGSNGSATASATGGTSPYTYLWSNSQTNANATGLIAGTYTVTVTDANGCTSQQTVIITQPTVIVASANSTNTSCGNSTGTATASASGGTGPYTYSWNNSQTTIIATGLGANSYTVYVTDANGCTQTATVTVGNTNGPTASAIINAQVLCNGGNNGNATASAIGGTSPYTYLWSNSQTNANATGLIAGTYTVTVTDANGCTSQQTITITEPILLTSIPTSTNVNCNGGNNATATVTPSGGTSPYTYVWSNSQTNQTASNLIAGNYTVTVTDANGCTSQQIITITQPTVITASTSTTSSSCGNSTGTATANASGGTGPYTYSWSNSQTTITATGLGAGIYTVYVTDANGCTQTATATINNSNGPTASVSLTTSILCNGGTNASATGNATGGTSPYTYSWNNSQTNSVATGLGAGTYTVTVTDANGCTSQQTITITEPSVITVINTSTPDTCLQTNGTANATASGGTGLYTYLWSNSSTSQNISNLTSGTYTVTITDANGCTQTQTVNVGNVGGAIANAGFDVTITQGNSTTLNGSGGVSYSWYPSATLSCSTCQNPSATPSSTTTYYVVVTNANGCTGIDSVTVFVDTPCNGTLLSTLMPNAFTPNNDGRNDELCIPANICVINFKLSIYDRWGEKVFETDNVSICWDGSYKGQELNTGVFVYFLEAELSNGETMKFNGNISLIK